ncbi:hypothetical protein ACFVYC_09735 [Pseudarthrobacter sp. NPDC058329]|uniref:aldose epimerase family protein n=1 Tax=Pseudarthrobacter sp. NPDC058329 TaxID=3346448 RepID=UPI0036D81C6C
MPLCLPWFGGTAAPRHGFARLVPWQLSEVQHQPEHHTLTFDLNHTAAAPQPEEWQHPFHARFHVQFGASLTMTLSVTHLGNQPAIYEPALHPYFQVADVRRVRISGLDGASFTDYSTTASSEPELVFNEQGIDRVYTCSKAVTIHDDGNNRDIILHAPDAGSRIIWNPGAQGSRATPDFTEDDWKSFLCVELGNVKENAITLAPGQRHTFTSSIQVIPRP